MANDSDRLRILQQLESAVADLRRLVTSGVELSPAPGPGPVPVPPGPTPQPFMPGLRGSVAGRGVEKLELARKLEQAERFVDRIAQVDALSAAQKVDLSNLARASFQDQLRGLARGEEVAAAVNITVSGTGTISVD